jgi:hypothetical protein
MGIQFVYDDALFFEFYYSKLFKDWVGLILIKEKIFVLLLTNSITKNSYYNDDKILDLHKTLE